jgi:predicted peroxiredoxin
VKVLFVNTAGGADPTRASLGLHLAANGSVEVGQDAVVLLAGDATEMVAGDAAQTLEGVGVPPVRDLLTKLRDHAIPVYV